METLIITAPILAWSLWHYHRTTSDARKGWARNWDGDPRTLAIIMDRLGWLERKRLTRELGR